MDIGLLTAPFHTTKTFAEVAEWAAEAGYSALEVSPAHFDAKQVLKDDGKEVRRILARTGVRISGLEYYRGFDAADPAPYQQAMRELFAAAQAVGADTVTAFAGFPTPGKDRWRTIKEDVARVFTPLADDAAKRGVKIAFENWFETNLQGLGHFQCLTEALPQPNIGFNFDPSHLAWQGVDYLSGVEEFKARIFHTHAKDVHINETKRARLGVLTYGWWEYVLPGYGIIDWGRWVRALAAIRYDGVLSVEHEDGAFGAEDGFRRSLAHLSQFVPRAAAHTRRKEASAHG
jgi:sugar phosphate isomerase/epimerase